MTFEGMFEQAKEKLLPHVGHHTEIIHYGTEKFPINIAIECMDCNEVLLDFTEELEGVMKFYQGRRKENEVFVHVKNLHDPWFKPLTHIMVHSPDGFEWGYPGSGPSDLALAILVDYFKEDPRKIAAYALAGKGEPSAAVQFHQQFKDKFIVGLPKNTWRLTEKEIKEWYYGEIGALCKECKRGMIESDGCREFAIPMKDGTMAAPIKHGEETRADWGRDGKRCHDCGAKPGHYHHPGCDVEECPGCGGQLLGCECVASDASEIAEIESGTEEGIG